MASAGGTFPIEPGSARGRPALAGDDAQIVPLLEAAPETDVFADPFEDGAATPMRPALVILDDGSEAAGVQDSRTRL
jgi:hypothetical protein